MTCAAKTFSQKYMVRFDTQGRGVHNRAGREAYFNALRALRAGLDDDTLW